MKYTIVEKNNEFTITGKSSSGGGFIAFGDTFESAKSNGKYGLEGAILIDCINDIVEVYDIVKNEFAKKAYDELNKFDNSPLQV